MRARLLASLLALAPLAFPHAAAAHGAAPISVDVHFVEKNGTTQPVLETTYGLVQRTDKGEWRLACEETISPGLKWYSVEPDGHIGMGHASGFAWSDDGCYYHPATGISSSVRQLARVQPAQSGPPAIVLVLDLYAASDAGKNLVISTDRGHTFSLVHVPEGMLVNAVQADPRAPGRLLATAQDANRKYWLLDSPDLGATWTTHQLAFETGITKILATTSGGLFVRRTASGQNELWRSVDQGVSFTKVLSPAASLIFLEELAPDDYWTSAGLGEVYRSHDGGATWEKQANAGDMMCLRSDGTQLYACVNDPTTNTALVKSTDHGATWQPVYRFDETVGMEQCPADSQVAQVCDDLWLLVSVGLKVPQKPVPPTKPPDDGSKGCASADVSALALAAVALLRQRSRATAATRDSAPSRSTFRGPHA